jgi:hypothetical protein
MRSALFKLYDFSRHTSRIEKSLGIEAAFLPGFSFGFNAVWIRDYLHNTTACSQIYHNHEAQSKVNDWRVVAQFRGCMPAGSNEPTYPSR